KRFVTSNITSPDSAVIIALLIGDKSEIPNNIKENFRYSGVSHIMAVSGLHLAVFCGTVSFLLKKLRIPKVWQVVITFSSVIFYMALAGFSKSILRAGIMMIVMLCSRLFNERSDALNSLGIAVFIICLNPFAVTDAGALLTVTAVLGLVVINPVFIRIYRPKTKLVNYVYRSVCASLSVFLTTLPVICITFGYVSMFGIILNIVIIPLAQLALVSSFLMAIFGWFKPFAFILSCFCRFSASMMFFITEKVANIPYAVADVSENRIFLAIGSVLIFFGISSLFWRKTLLKRTAIIALTVFITVVSVSAFIEHNNIYVKDINGYYTTSVVIYNKRNAVIIGVDDSSQYYAVSNMIKSKNLHISMIADLNDSVYSKKLANKFGALNYVCDNENIKYLNHCSNFFCDEDFIVDLWEQLNVEYKSNKQNKYILLKIYDTEFMCIKKYECSDFADHVIYLDNESDYDIVYTVNENGFTERRLHEWQR
ncbi:MAG: ComEC/Rec2 family competence protein, partial [Eubacterium sp.]|nr:ComEC/Rec2 family competence protein [Eubacterium sp.]